MLFGIPTRATPFHQISLLPFGDQGVNAGILLSYQDQTVAQFGTLDIQKIKVCDFFWFFTLYS